MATQKNRVILYIPFIVQTIEIQYRNLVSASVLLALLSEPLPTLLAPIPFVRHREYAPDFGE